MSQVGELQISNRRVAKDALVLSAELRGAEVARCSFRSRATLGRLDIVVDELSRMRDLVGGRAGERAGDSPNRIPRALAASGAEPSNSSNFAKVVAKPANLPKL